MNSQETIVKTREDALTWWRSMDLNQQYECCNTFGEYFNLIKLTTGFQIERLYEKVLKAAAMTIRN